MISFIRRYTSSDFVARNKRAPFENLRRCGGSSSLETYQPREKWEKGENWKREWKERMNGQNGTDFQTDKRKREESIESERERRVSTRVRDASGLSKRLSWPTLRTTRRWTRSVYDGWQYSIWHSINLRERRLCAHHSPSTSLEDDGMSRRCGALFPIISMALVKPKIAYAYLSRPPSLFPAYMTSVRLDPLSSTGTLGPAKISIQGAPSHAVRPTELIDDQIDLTSISYTRPSWPVSSWSFQWSRSTIIEHASQHRLWFLYFCFWCALLRSACSRKLHPSWLIASSFFFLPFFFFSRYDADVLRFFCEINWRARMEHQPR